MSIGEAEDAILKGEYRFAMNMIKSITVQRVIEGEYNVHIDPCCNLSPIDLEVGSETSRIYEIPIMLIRKIK